MPRKFFLKYLPSREAVRNNRHIARFGTLFLHPNLWHVNRRSVSGGVAAGMFAGLVPGSNPVQFTFAALLAVAFRVNLPVAVAVTLYTNPLTIGPIYVIAYWIGTLLLPGDIAPFTHPPGFDWSNLALWLRALFEWALSLGKPLAVGLFALAIGLAIAGYVAVQLAWRAQVMFAWRRRKARRAGSGSP
jgi:hypothetical protein